MPLSDLPAWKAAPDGTVLWVSPQYVAAFGLDPVGRNIRDVFAPDLAELFLASNARAMESGTPETTRFMLRGPWVSVKWRSQNGSGPVICGTAVRS